MKSKKLLIVFCFLIAWVFQNAQLIFGYGLHDHSESEFSSFVYKGPLSYCDVLTYAGHINYSSEHFSLLRPDGLIKENSEKYFADGNIINVYSGWILNWVGDIDLVPLIGSILPVFLSVLLLFRIKDLLWPNAKNGLFSIGIVVVVMLTSFEDFLGVGKFIEGFVLNSPSADDILPLGYGQRFPYGQFSNVIFIFWIYCLIRWFKTADYKNQLLLGLSLILCHYTYFYYWSYAIPITIAIAILSKFNLKKVRVLLLLYFLGTSFYWMNFYDFNTTEFAAEYLDRVKGEQFFPFTWLFVFGIIGNLSFLKKDKLIGGIVLITPLITFFLLRKITSIFVLSHWIRIGGTTTLVISQLSLLILILRRSQYDLMDKIGVLNYYLVITLNSLTFIIGYNVQPYHWIYTSYFIVLSIGLIHQLFVFFPQKLNLKLLSGLTVVILVFGFLNSFRFANRNAPYWSLKATDVELIEFFNSIEERVVIGGNNIMPLITLTAHDNLYLYTGSTSHSRSTYHELYYRFIDNFKRMGYADSLILTEYNKYKGHSEYWETYNGYNKKDREVQGAKWPDNLTLAAEALHHYFRSYDDQIPVLKRELNQFKPEEFNFSLEYLVLDKNTFPKEAKVEKGKLVFENEDFSVFQCLE